MDRIDIYCERVTAAFWAEPVNALTNFAFLIAAFALWRLRQRAPALEPTLLIAALALTGIGSFLFHTFATRWAAAADVLPILVFQLLFLWTYVRRRIGWGPAVAAGLVIAYLAFGSAMARTLPAMNGSQAYLAALGVLLVLGAHHAATATTQRYDLLAAGAVFAVSLTFRTIDHSVCAAFPLGTHFLWHLLNAAVLFLAARPLVLQSYRSSR